MNIIILGAQASGKGTQARLLAKELKMFYFESGAFLRKLAKTDTSIDKRINKRGEMLPDEEMFSLMAKHIEENNPSRENLLLEGYPRTIKQYELLKTWLAEKSQKIDYVIYLEISKKEAMRRLSARRVDRKTGEIYNLITNPPGPEVNQDDLLQRPDDKPEAIKKRLEMYQDNTLPLIEALEKEGILEKIDGEQPIEKVFKDILTRIKKDK